MGKKKSFAGKRYFFSVVEEGIMNPKYKGYRGGRIEVFDKKRENGYASYEARFLIPEEFIEGFRELFDFVESDKPVYIDWREPKGETIEDENKK